MTPTPGGHFIKVCCCGNVLVQCRCPVPDKHVQTAFPCECEEPGPGPKKTQAPAVDLDFRTSILGEIEAEMKRQDQKWGYPHNHPNEDPGGWWAGKDTLDAMLRRCEDVEIPGARRAQFLCQNKPHTWPKILVEEVSEAVEEGHNPKKLRTELVQVAAVAVQWINDIDRKEREAREG